MMFNENQFRQLIDDTENTVVFLGTNSNDVLNRHRRFAERLIEFLKGLNVPFDRDLCLRWVDSLEHDPASALNSSYVDWIACRRFVILLAEQEAGTLNSWKHYLSQPPEMPKSENLLEILSLYRVYLAGIGFQEKTVDSYASYARRLLLYMEGIRIVEIRAMGNQALAGYFVSKRFQGREPEGIRSETRSLKNFICFLEENGYTDVKSLHYVVPRHRVPTQRIITTLTPEMEADIMEDEPDSLVDKRDKAVCLLALHIGLRSCDIRNLKFGDIDWEKGRLTTRQSKTGVGLQMPLDNETQNAIIDYILNERRDCDSEYIFVTSVGPAQKIARRGFRIKYRAQNTEIPHDGLHIFRRTYASRLLQCGTPLPLISEMLGHISRNAVQSYLSTDEAKMKRCALDLAMIPFQRGDS